MKTFNEFVEMKLVDAQITECAALFEETDIDAEEYLNALMEGTDFAEGWGDWLKGVGSKVGAALGRWGTAAGQLGKSVVDGGLRSGMRQASDTVAGPSVKFDKALATLQELVQFLKSHKELSGWQSAGDHSKTTGDYLQGIVDLLMKEKNNMPKMQAPEVKQDYAARDGGESKMAARQAAGQMRASPIVDDKGNPFMRKVG